MHSTESVEYILSVSFHGYCPDRLIVRMEHSLNNQEIDRQIDRGNNIDAERKIVICKWRHI